MLAYGEKDSGEICWRGNASRSLQMATTMNPQETSTIELVEIIRRQAESFQKPNEEDVVWKELMTRYRWPGCPKEDLTLIGSLDRLLRPLNNGSTKLPPLAIQIPGAGIPPPPPYYRGKVSLSQVVNLTSAQTGKNDSQQTDNLSPPIRNSFSLEKLRSELTSSQQKYLNLFWQHYLDYVQWPQTVEFHRDHDIKDVQESLRTPPLNGGIVMEQTGGGDDHYELTLIGILLTKDGNHYEKMRIRLLEFLSKKYYHSKKDERTNRYSDEEIAEEIKLGVEDIKMLGKVGGFDSIYRTSGSSSIGGHWFIDFPKKEIQSIPHDSSFFDYHERIVSDQYYPERKVFIADRHAAQRAATSPKDVFSGAFDPLAPFDTRSLTQNDASSPMPVPDVSFVKDEKLRSFATAAAQEASRCFGAKAFTATAVMAGGATEAVLLDLLLQYKDKMPVSKNGPIERWQLDELIKTASKMDLLGAATTNLTQFVQQHRNLIHPGKFLREKRIIAQGDAHIIWGIFIKICEELSSRNAVGAASF